MDEDFDLRELTDCERVERILQGGLVVESENLYSFFLWRAKWHAGTCDSCQQRHPGVLATLAGLVTEAETALALEVDVIRGEHLSEASEIARRSILDRLDWSNFESNGLLSPEPPQSNEERSGVEESPPLALMKSLAQAGRRVKRVFAAVHGEGFVWFNVVPDLDDDEQEDARNQCAGLVRHLSPESREFAFSAALAAELLPNFAWFFPEPEAPVGAHLGVLYKVVRAAARGYVDAYLQNLNDLKPQPTSSGDPRHTDLSEPPRRRTPEGENDAEMVDTVYEAQTVMMGVQSDLMKRMGLLEEAWDKSQDHGRDAIEAECKATLRTALGSRFDELEEKTQNFLLMAERLYTHPPSDSDFSPVLIFLTKAFEFEHRRRVIEPLIDDLEILTITDVSFKGDLSRFTLGQYLALFMKYPISIEPMFERLGLQSKDLHNSIVRVNKEKGVKHSETRSKTEATAFRTVFVGRESVFNSLFPRPAALK